jgi:hypothetical protein
VKQIPILLNGEMVRAILDDRKTQTRRVVKSIDHDLLDMMSEDAESGDPDSELLELLYGPSTDDNGKSVADQWMVRCIECPEEGVLTLGQGFGRVGDQLWVRETWQGPLVPYELSHELFKHSEQFESPQYCEYRADGGLTPVFINADDEQCQRWRPSIHMPRWASRITLEITDVRVERLQDISEDDSMAEGIPFEGDQPSPRDNFSALWDSIKGTDSWDENPWVWVVEFKRVDSEVVS